MFVDENVCYSVNMTLLEWVNTVVVLVGIPSITGALIYVGRKLQLLDQLEVSNTKIRFNMKVVSDYLVRHHTKFDPTQLQAFSPLALTGVGAAFIKTIGFDTVFEANKADFFRVIDGEQPRLKYDVEACAIKSIFALSDKEYMTFLKVLFYNDPKRNMENTAPTLGVYIRDKYLEVHPEITQ